MKTFLSPKGTHRGGYVLLISVLVIGSIASIILTSLLILGTSASQVGLAVQQSSQALSITQGCAEYALAELKKSLSYGGSEFRTLANGTCEILPVGGTGNNNRIVCIEGRVGDVFRRLEIVLSRVLPQTKIDSWQEVSIFSLCE